MTDLREPSEEAAEKRAERVVLGRVAGAHGLRGEVRVKVMGDGPEHLRTIDEVWLGDGPGDFLARRYDVKASGSGRSGEVRLALEGVADRDAAEALKGRLVMAPAEALPALEEGDFYWHELIGCRVESASGETIGRVREIWETGAHDVLVIDGEDGRLRLVPTAAELMTEVDVVARRIVFADLPGLFEPADEA